MKKKRTYNKKKQNNNIIVIVICIIVVAAVIFGIRYYNGSKGFGEKNYSAKVKYSKQVKLSKIDWSGYTVCIDPGHGGTDPGTKSGDRNEKEDTLWLASKVATVLKDYGINVVMTRTKDTSVSLQDRAEAANNTNADLYVSIHRNYYEGSEAVNGIDIYINNAGTDADYKIGNTLKDKLSDVKGMQMKKVVAGSTGGSTENFNVINMTNMTACLIEMGYMSDEDDNKKFYKFSDEYAVAIAEGILEYFI